MIKTIVHYSDLHLRLYKYHERDKGILETALNEWKDIKPDRIVFTGDLVHSKKSDDTRINKVVKLVDDRNSKNMPHCISYR